MKIYLGGLFIRQNSYVNQLALLAISLIVFIRAIIIIKIVI